MTDYILIATLYHGQVLLDRIFLCPVAEVNKTLAQLRQDSPKFQYKTLTPLSINHD